MPWVRFTANFDWKPKPAITQAYLAGETRLVTRPCAAAAIARGIGRLTRKPSDAGRKSAIEIDVSAKSGR